MMRLFQSDFLFLYAGNISGCSNATSEDIQFAEYVTQSFLEDLSVRPEVREILENVIVKPRELTFL